MLLLQHVLKRPKERDTTADARAGQHAVEQSGAVRMGSPALVLTVLMTGVSPLPSALLRDDQRMQCRGDRDTGDGKPTH